MTLLTKSLQYLNLFLLSPKIAVHLLHIDNLCFVFARLTLYLMVASSFPSQVTQSRTQNQGIAPRR